MWYFYLTHDTILNFWAFPSTEKQYYSEHEHYFWMLTSLSSSNCDSRSKYMIRIELCKHRSSESILSTRLTSKWEERKKSVLFGSLFAYFESCGRILGRN